MSKNEKDSDKAIFGGIRKISFEDFETDNSLFNNLSGFSSSDDLKGHLEFSELNDKNLIYVAMT